MLNFLGKPTGKLFLLRQVVNTSFYGSTWLLPKPDNVYVTLSNRWKAQKRSVRLPYMALIGITEFASCSCRTYHVYIFSLYTIGLNVLRFETRGLCEFANTLLLSRIRSRKRYVYLQRKAHDFHSSDSTHYRVPTTVLNVHCP